MLNATVTAVWPIEQPSLHRDYVIMLDTCHFYNTAVSKIDIVAKNPGTNLQFPGVVVSLV